mmetsp:Transcript_17078/g.14963  ORF Transcript_17078/g.14963 Transcript_17078/m.14963 type:complete len:114 (+) Transcript_17078:262-603(+)
MKFIYKQRGVLRVSRLKWFEDNILQTDSVPYDLLSEIKYRNILQLAQDQEPYAKLNPLDLNREQSAFYDTFLQGFDKIWVRVLMEEKIQRILHEELEANIEKFNQYCKELVKS